MPPNQAPAKNPNRRILIFGDSITYGAWDGEGGWSDRLKRYYHLKTIQAGGQPSMQLINLGIGGETSQGLLVRMENEIEARYSASWPLAIIIASGLNDSRSNNTEANVQVPLEDYKSNLHNLITAAKNHTKEVLLVGLTPVRDATLQNNDHIYYNVRIKQYDDAMSEVAAQHAIDKVPVYELFTPWLHELFSWDGLHPNDKGHTLLFDHIRPAVDRLITEGN